MDYQNDFIVSPPDGYIPILNTLVAIACVFLAPIVLYFKKKKYVDVLKKEENYEQIEITPLNGKSCVEEFGESLGNAKKNIIRFYVIVQAAMYCFALLFFQPNNYYDVHPLNRIGLIRFLHLLISGIAIVIFTESTIVYYVQMRRRVWAQRIFIGIYCVVIVFSLLLILGLGQIVLLLSSTSALIAVTMFCSLIFLYDFFLGRLLSTQMLA